MLELYVSPQTVDIEREMEIMALVSKMERHLIMYKKALMTGSLPVLFCDSYRRLREHSLRSQYPGSTPFTRENIATIVPDMI